jgi:excisionase family DNA binding protein
MGENTATNHWFTIPEAADHIRLKVDTIREHIYAGQLKAYKVGPARNARVRIKESDLDALLIPYTPCAAGDARPSAARGGDTA